MQSGKSLNRVILEILYRNSGFDQNDAKAPAHSLRKLAGGWSAQEADDFMNTIKPCRRIDEEMWA